MTTEQRNLRITNEHNSDGTHNQKAATTLQAKTGWYVGPTIQSDVTASRAIGTVYQNTTGRVMWVAVSSATTVFISNYFKALTDASNPPTTVVAIENPTGTGGDYELTFLVLPNNYYKVTHDLGTPTLDKWVETY